MFNLVIGVLAILQALSVPDETPGKYLAIVLGLINVGFGVVQLQGEKQ